MQKAAAHPGGFFVREGSLYRLADWGLPGRTPTMDAR